MHWTSFAAGAVAGQLVLYAVWRAYKPSREAEVLELTAGLMGIMKRAQQEGVDPDVLMRELKQMVR